MNGFPVLHLSVPLGHPNDTEVTSAIPRVGRLSVGRLSVGFLRVGFLTEKEPVTIMGNSYRFSRLYGGWYHY